MSKLKNIAEIRLGSGHSLLKGDLPQALNLSQFQEVRSKELNMALQSFGLFDRSTPNYTTYYPDVTAEDLKPKDDEFINPVFRALSGVIVHKNTRPIDFGKNIEVLRNSMELLKGQTLNVDHETALGNAIGAVSDVQWEDSFTQSGIKIPSGINALLKIDGKSNPRIARGILMDPPSIHSTSVTVQYEWEKSHPKMSAEEFYSKFGTFDSNGELIRQIVTGIRLYRELSLVGHGADPFAQKKDDKGKLNNPKYAASVYNSDKAISNKFFMVDFKGFNSNRDGEIESEKGSTRPFSLNNKPNKNLPMTVLEKLIAQLGLSLEIGVDGLTEEQETQLMTEIDNITKPTEVTTLKEKVTELETQLNQEKLSSKSAKDFQEAQLKALRDETKRLYALVTKEPKDSVNETIENADMPSLKLLQNTYQEQLEEKMPLTCKSCGSHEVSRSSAITKDPQNEGNKNKPVSALEARQRLTHRPEYASLLHGVKDK